MPIAQPLRLDRLTKGIFSVVNSVVSPATVGWSYGQSAFEQRGADLVNIQPANGPTMWSQNGKRGRVIVPFDSITLDVTGSTSGTRNVIKSNNIDFFVDGDGVLDAEGIRDAFLTLLNADPTNDPWIAAAGVNPSELVITPNSFGSVFSLEIVGELAAVSQTLSDEAALLTEGTRVWTFTIECFSKDRTLRGGAWSLMSTIEGIFESEEHIETLNSFGVAVWDKGLATDISAIAGANWETRVTLDVQFAMRSAKVEAVDQIETVQGIINALSSGGSIIATQTFNVATP